MEDGGGAAPISFLFETSIENRTCQMFSFTATVRKKTGQSKNSYISIYQNCYVVIG